MQLLKLVTSNPSSPVVTEGTKPDRFTSLALREQVKKLGLSPIKGHSSQPRAKRRKVSTGSDSRDLVIETICHVLGVSPDDLTPQDPSWM